MIKTITLFFLISCTSICAQDFFRIKSDTLTSHKDTLSTINDTLLTQFTLKTPPDSLPYIPEPDTLIPISTLPVTFNSRIISNRNLLFSDYRYSGDFLRQSGFNFIKDFGFIGQPNESFIYGFGQSSVNILSDGLLLNDAVRGSFNLNMLQSEPVDSVEMIPLPRGFLYGADFNPVSVNFIQKDFISNVPYSRVKYYEGPTGEAMVDVLFNSLMGRRLNMFLDITNRKVDAGYLNSSFSIWQMKSAFKYFFSNSINTTGYFSYSHYKADLNGGVDVDSILATGSLIDDVMYNSFLAPVRYIRRNTEVKHYNFGLRGFAELFHGSRTTFDLYHRIYLNTLNNVDDDINLNSSNKNKLYGINLRHNHKSGIVLTDIKANYENSRIRNYEKYVTTQDSVHYAYGESSLKMSRYFISASLGVEIANGKLYPSIFYRTGSTKINGYRTNFSGGGTDISYYPLEGLKLYTGYSIFNSVLSHTNVKVFEAGAELKYKGLYADTRYFSVEDFVFTYEAHFTGPVPAFFPTNEKNRKGLGVILNYDLEFIKIETNTSFYFSKSTDNFKPIELPELLFSGGIYYTGILFNNNLELKTGFRFYYVGERNSFGYNFSPVKVSPNYRLDFTLAGEIQKSAIAYFAWENLLNNLYFITPYYPMPESGVRFGIAWEILN